MTIKTKLWRLLFDNKGVTSVFFAINLVALLSVAALVIDLGHLALNRQMLVNAVDAAALAGARELPQNPELARDIAVNYARSNGATETVQAEVSADKLRLSVAASKNVNYFLARIMGFESGEARARSVAAVAAVKAVNGAAPLAVPNADFQFGNKHVLKQGAGMDSPLGPGTYSALSLGGTGADQYEINLSNGFDGRLAVGDTIDTETGNMSNPTKRAIDSRLAKCKHSPPCTLGNFDPGCSRILILPIYDSYALESGQIKSVTITGFAAFLVTDVIGQGTENYIEGYFVRMVVAGETDPDQQDYGLKGVRLVQ